MTNAEGGALKPSGAQPKGGGEKPAAGSGGTRKKQPPVERVSKYEPSMTIALVAYWVLPVLVFAIASRFVVYTGPAVQPHSQSKPVRLDMDKMHSGTGGDSIGSAPAQKLSAAPTVMPERKKSGRVPTLLANKPSSYREVSALHLPKNLMTRLFCPTARNECNTLPHQNQPKLAFSIFRLLYRQWKRLLDVAWIGRLHPMTPWKII